MSYDLVSKPLPGVQVNRLHPLAQGLVGCYLLNEGAGTRVRDIIGGNDGILTNMNPPANWIGTQQGIALNFDGTNDRIISQKNIGITGNQPRTISFWAKTSQGGNNPIIIWGSSAANQLSMVTVGAGATTNYYTYFADVVGIATLQSNTWTHVVVTYFGTSVTFYMNGVLDVVRTIALSNTTVTPLTIGFYDAWGASYAGQLSNLLIYNRALSSEEVRQLYQTPYAMFDLFDFPPIKILPKLRLIIETKYDAGGRLRSIIDTKYHSISVFRKIIETKYQSVPIFRKIIDTIYSSSAVLRKIIDTKYHSSTIKIRWTLETIYSGTQAVRQIFETKYHGSEGVVQWYDSNDLPLVDFVLPDVQKGQISATIILHLWNAKGVATGALTMANCRVSASIVGGAYTGGTDLEGQEVVTEKWIETKSNGVSGAGITDDAQASFTPVGGDPNVGGNYLAIGNIPPNCARHIHLRVNVPISPDTTFNAFPELVISYDMT